MKRFQHELRTAAITLPFALGTQLDGAPVLAIAASGALVFVAWLLLRARAVAQFGYHSPSAARGGDAHRRAVPRR